MKRITLFGLAGAATALLAACGSSSPAATPTPTTRPAAATPTTILPSATTPTTTASTTAGSELTVATTSLGKVLVDAQGRTLYLYTKDTQNKPGTCESTCAANWPPLIAAKLPTVSSSLTASKLSLMKRTDGTEQVAYNGWPLYLYAKDSKTGDVSGENVAGSFFAVDAAGIAVK